MAKVSLFVAVLLLLSSCGKNSVDVEPQPLYGQLSVTNSQLVSEKGEPIVLRGVSFGWHNWWPRFYNASAVEWLKEDWNCTVVRAAMGVEPQGAYLSTPDTALACVEEVIKGAINAGIYVIVDWHSHGVNTQEAKQFFATMAQKYGQYPNIIWEIFNEPVEQSWSTIKEYAHQVIDTIRVYDPDNVILVGCPHWNQDLHMVAQSPLEGVNNVMYTMHYYAGTHKADLRNRCENVRQQGIPIFISEAGGCAADGDGAIDYNEWEQWIEWCEKNKISWTIWCISDKRETSAMLTNKASSQGNWEDDVITENGLFVKKKLKCLN